MAAIKIPSAYRYRKQIAAFGAHDRKHDSGVLPFDTAASVYNFDMSSGALRDGYGICANENVPIDDARRYWVYKFYSDTAGKFVEQYVYQDGYGLVHFYDSSENRRGYISGTPYAPMHAINYRLNSKDVLLLSCDGCKLMTWDGVRLVEHANSPKVSSMALHNERLFVTSRDQPTKVFFSDDLDPTGWVIGENGAGFIELMDERGDFNKVVSFGNYLYIFRDHGISRVTAYGDQKEFAVVNMFVTAGRIYPSSIAICGATIVFLASDGLYAFDGYECHRILRNLDGLIVPQDDCACAFYTGKYYLACKMDFADQKTVGCESDEHTANGLLVYDTMSGEYSVARGLDIRFLNACSYNGKDFLMACDGAKSGVIEMTGSRFSIALPKHWKSPISDFSSPDKIKLVREVYIESNTETAVSLTDGVKRKQKSAKSGRRRLRFGFAGRAFALEIDCAGCDCNILPPTVVFSQF